MDTSKPLKTYSMVLETRRLNGTSLNIHTQIAACDPDDAMAYAMDKITMKAATFIRSCREMTQSQADEYYESEFDREQGED